MGEGYFRTYQSLITHFKDFCTAGLLCKLISKYEYYKNTSQLVEGKWFYYTREQIEKDFYFSEYTQRAMIKKLEEEGIVETIIFPNSIPQKKYYTIHFDKLAQILSR